MLCCYHPCHLYAYVFTHVRMCSSSFLCLALSDTGLQQGRTGNYWCLWKNDPFRRAFAPQSSSKTALQPLICCSESLSSQRSSSPEACFSQTPVVNKTFGLRASAAQVLEGEPCRLVPTSISPSASLYSGGCFSRTNRHNGVPRHWCLQKTQTTLEKKTPGELSVHRIRGWRAVSAEGSHGQGLHKSAVFFQTPVFEGHFGHIRA